MLLHYHDDILNNSFDNEKEYFNSLSDFKYITKYLLKNGLYYPDVPCNDMVYANNNQIKYLNYNSCKIPISFIYLLNESGYGLKEIVQSYNGRDVLAHSMTYDPKLTVLDTRQKILKRLEILYMLALNDNSLLNKCNNKKCENMCYKSMFNSYDCINPEPNIFWLGQILHCIQDSYSRGHTLRELSNMRGGRVSDTTEKEDSIPSFKLIKLIGDKLDEINLKDIKIDSNSNKDIQKYLKTIINDNEYHKIIDNNPKDISHMFKLILFFKNQKEIITDLFNGEENLPLEINKNNNKSNYERYPYIMSFRYHPHQHKCGILFHISYDTKKKTEEAGFEEFMINNTKDILNLYKKHVLSLKTGNHFIKTCITEMITYIAQNVFPILDEYKDRKSDTKCNHHHCECKLELDQVYKIYNESSSQTGGYHKKYLKYKIKYLELKNSI